MALFNRVIFSSSAILLFTKSTDKQHIQQSNKNVGVMFA